MTINSRAKGKAGELELAKVLRSWGLDEARRGVQYRGSSDSPDVIGIPGVHIECKRTERGNLYAWLDQARADATPRRVPLVAHRRSRREWVAILKLEDFLEFYCMVKGSDNFSEWMCEHGE